VLALDSVELVDRCCVAWVINPACNRCVKVEPRERNTTAFVAWQTNVSRGCPAMLGSKDVAKYEVEQLFLVPHHVLLEK
jgi:hypothetical protein